MINDAVFIDGKTPYYQSRLLNEYGIRHAFFTRAGGVSEGVFESLNFAEGIGKTRDSEENVIMNYEIAAKCFGLSAKDVCRTYQTHTSVVVFADESKRGVGIVKPKFDYGVDGLVTRERTFYFRSGPPIAFPFCFATKARPFVPQCMRAGAVRLAELPKTRSI